MAALGSEVQAASTELVSVIEEMKERRHQLDVQIRKDEEEKQQLLRDIKALEVKLGTVESCLASRQQARNDLDKTISDTSAAFKSIVEASRKLLNSAKEESTHLQKSANAFSTSRVHLQRVGMQAQFVPAVPAVYPMFNPAAFSPQQLQQQLQQQGGVPHPQSLPGFPPMLQDPQNYPEDVKEMLASVQSLYRADTREKAIHDLSKNRDKYTALGPTLWYSVGVMPIFLQEIISMYPLLHSTPPVTLKATINRVSSVLTLLQTVAHHEVSRKPFLESQICLFLYPFLRVSSNERTEVLRLTSLGVIGALVKSDDPFIINYLLGTEIFPLCLRIMEQAVEISKIISTFIVQKLLMSEEGLQYACQTPNRFTAVAEVLQHMVSQRNDEGAPACSARLLRHIIRCYLRLSDNERAREALPQMLPKELRDNTFYQYLEKDGSMKKWLLQLLVNIGDEGAMRVHESAKSS